MPAAWAKSLTREPYHLEHGRAICPPYTETTRHPALLLLEPLDEHLSRPAPDLVLADLVLDAVLEVRIGR